MERLHLPAPVLLLSEELSLPFVSSITAQHMTVPLHCRHSYASLVTPPPPSLRESGAAPYSDAPTALCGPGCAVVSLASASLAWSDRTAPRLRPLQLLLPNCIRFSCCSPTAPASACCSRIVRFRLRPLQLLLPECVRLLSRTHSMQKYN